MADKLSIYNGTLLLLKARRIATLSDNRAERRSLDAVWAETLDYMLEQGFWDFAGRTEELMSSDTAIPQFGYRYAYELPDDYLRTLRISDNEYLEPDLKYYEPEGDHIFTDVNPLYLRYVSNHYAYGGDPGKWKPTFARAFEYELAWRAGPQIASLSSTDREEIRKERKRMLTEAKSKDGANQPMVIRRPGQLVTARAGHRGHTNYMRRTPYG